MNYFISQFGNPSGVIGKITGESGLTGSLESLLETTFFIPSFLYFDPASKLRKEVGKK